MPPNFEPKFGFSPNDPSFFETVFSPNAPAFGSVSLTPVSIWYWSAPGVWLALIWCNFTINSHTMHCPPETSSPLQGSGGSAPGSSWVLAIQKPKKPVYEGKIGGKIYILFCTEFSICTIFTGDQCQRFHTPGVGGPGVQLPEARWF